MPGGQPPARLRPGARGQRRRAAGEPARVLRGGVGCAALGAPRHADQLAPLGRGGRLHRRRLRRHGPRGSRPRWPMWWPGSATPARSPAGWRSAAPLPGFAAYEEEVAAQPPSRPSRGVRGELDVLLVGHHRPAQGHQAAAGGRPARRRRRAFGLLVQGLYGVGEGSVYLSPAPLYHAAPPGGPTPIHRLGGTVVVMERFDPVQVLELIERHRVTHVQFVPTHLVRLLKLPAEERDRASTCRAWRWSCTRPRRARPR